MNTERTLDQLPEPEERQEKEAVEAGHEEAYVKPKLERHGSVDRVTGFTF